jgi:hypothetical protein
LGEFVERLQKRLDDKDEEIQNLNSMIVTIDEYENLPKYGTRSSYALNPLRGISSPLYDPSTLRAKPFHTSSFVLGTTNTTLFS